jgi:hypothetical protein
MNALGIKNRKSAGVWPGWELLQEMPSGFLEKKRLDFQKLLWCLGAGYRMYAGGGQQVDFSGFPL